MENIDEQDIDEVPAIEQDVERQHEDLSANDYEKEHSVELNAIHNANNVEILKLPREVIVYILKWVVSDSLDVVSLGRWAAVCKDFYVLSLEPAIWHAMCQRIWGERVIRKPYSSWQSLFISQPHVHIHGVYISRTSYVRTGDASITLTYKPYYCVEYFRIFRFFTNGEVLMLTTPQDPREVVHKLEYRNKKVQGLLLGRYLLQEDNSQNGVTISATLKAFYSPKDKSHLQSGRSRRANRSAPKSTNEYKVELKLTSTSSRKKFNKLVWTHHSCCTRYTELEKENTTTYDISRQYPALYFNRIKSFTAESYYPV